MKKTILISTLVSNGAGSAQILDNSSVTVMSKADELEIQIRDQATTMFHDSNPHLEQCYHLLPGESSNANTSRNMTELTISNYGKT